MGLPLGERIYQILQYYIVDDKCRIYNIFVFRISRAIKYVKVLKLKEELDRKSLSIGSSIVMFFSAYVG